MIHTTGKLRPFILFYVHIKIEYFFNCGQGLSLFDESYGCWFAKENVFVSFFLTALNMEL
jgi:hypothetical protein